MVIRPNKNKIDTDFNIFETKIGTEIEVPELNGLLDADDVARREYFNNVSSETNEIFVSLLSTEPTVVNKYLTKNKYSRPGTVRKKTTKIVLHYVGVPNVPAINTRNYFENLKAGVKVNGRYVYASSHYVIGLDGEIIKCMPESEIAYTSNSANSYSIGIECAHLNADGKYSEKEYRSMVWLCSKLAKERNLDPLVDFERHHDITGKLCPMWYVLHKDAWNQFKKDCSRVVKGEDLDAVLNNTSNVSTEENPLRLVNRKNYEFKTTCKVVGIAKNDYVNVRASRPNNGVLGERLFEVHIDDTLTVGYVLDDWAYINYKGRNGFMNIKYLEIVKEETNTKDSLKLQNKKNYEFKTFCKVVGVSVNSHLNVRSTRPVDGKLGDEVYHMFLGDTCTVGYVLDDWAYVCHKNKYGFASTKYLEIIE